ncbi:uncharacterized protein [Argopecten irradians]|uniref:uncharacterized protein n=1 Tax=Argopecten irradians TaxID=31199 RepID=UPI0037110A0A
MAEVDWTSRNKVRCVINENHCLTISRRKTKCWIKIRKGKRDLALSPEVFSTLCDLKESILLACAFVENGRPRSVSQRHVLQLEEAGAYRSPRTLYEMVRRDGKHSIGLSRIKHWLQQQDPYSLNRPVRRHFRRRVVLTSGLNQQFDSDLMDVSNLSKYNDGVRFILVCIDDFSRYLMVAPLKNKTSDTVISGLESIFLERAPQKIRTDRGKEFTSNKTESFFRARGIEHFVTDNAPIKANFAERVIRTIRNGMYRYFNHKQSYDYLSVLPDLIKNYNETPHSSLHGLAPRDVTPENEVDLLMKLYYPVQKLAKQNVDKWTRFFVKSANESRPAPTRTQTTGTLGHSPATHARGLTSINDRHETTSLPIQVVAPTQQIVQQARSTLKRERPVKHKNKGKKRKTNFS